ncbi:MAG: hypothetical protein RLT87_02825 [Gammaproteobacteria bacterium]
MKTGTLRAVTAIFGSGLVINLSKAVKGGVQKQQLVVFWRQ